jgi:hypothetical protein
MQPNSSTATAPLGVIPRSRSALDLERRKEKRRWQPPEPPPFATPRPIDRPRERPLTHDNLERQEAGFWPVSIMGARYKT